MGQGDAELSEHLLAGRVEVGAEVGLDERVPVGTKVVIRQKPEI